MDALALLENMGLKVKMQGSGTVISQSVDKGIKITENQIIVLKT
jgi:cell division protein FtsI (penicillin-binding protein 3)